MSKTGLKLITNIVVMISELYAVGMIEEGKPLRQYCTHFTIVVVHFTSRNSCHCHICMFQADVTDMFHVFLADGDKKSFTYNQQTTVFVSKAHVTRATCRFALSRHALYQIGNCALIEGGPTANACMPVFIGIYRGNIPPKSLIFPQKVSKLCKTISLRLLVTGL